jgi:hypothetical protein
MIGGSGLEEQVSIDRVVSIGSSDSGAILS